MTLRLSDESPDAAELRVQDALARAEHGFANSLALIASVVASHNRRLPETETIPVRDVKLALAKLSARIEAVASLHRRLSVHPGDGVVELRTYLGQVIAALRQAFDASDAEFISFDLQCESELPVKAAGAMGLFVLEAVTNSIRFAAGTSIVVSLRRGASNQWVLEVADGGPGLPQGLDTEAGRGSGLGLRHMRSIARQLDADLSFAPLTPGLRVRLVWPAS